MTGIDLTPEFCEAATALAEWTGLSGRTGFRVGDATATGLPGATADAALTVHVAMNIPEKPALYAEAFRVLRPGGRFVVYDVLQGEGGEVRYPVPWAEDSSTSFLATPEDVRGMLRAAGFDILAEADSTAESLAWFRVVQARTEQDGPPPVTFAAFLGEEFGWMAAKPGRQPRRAAHPHRDVHLRAAVVMAPGPSGKAPERSSAPSLDFPGLEAEPSRWTRPALPRRPKAL